MSGFHRQPKEIQDRPESEFFTVQGLAWYLNLHVMTVYRYLKMGKIPGAIKILGTWRIKKDTFIRSLDEKP